MSTTSFVKAALLVLMGTLPVGCASVGRPAPPASSGGSEPHAAGAPEREPLPPLPIGPRVEPGGSQQRIQQLITNENDLRLVIRGLAESFGLGYQIDPAVQGRVTTSLRDVTLPEALDAIVLPHGYSYQLDGQVLRVTRSRLQTQIFTLDYLSMSRIGAGTTTIQRQLDARSRPGSGGGTFGNIGGGADVIQTVSVSDLWQEMRISMDGIIFDSEGQAPRSTAGSIERIPAGQPGQLGISAPGAFSRSAADGRRLIINPSSGTIMVTASPEKLADVGAFLATIEASVQRQVLIEAKIVEVTLNRRFEFGIDWSVVQRLGNVALRLAGGPSGGQLTIDASPGEVEHQINAVLRVLEEQGDVSVLQSPSVRGLNNQWAVINASTDEVFFSVSRQPIIGPTGGTIGFNTEIEPQQISVGVTLNVLPQIAADNTITMNVRPVVTDVIEERSVVLPDGSQSTAPVIDRRESDTVVRMRNGETVVIGGLMTTKERNAGSGIPGLREVPVVGWLFGGSTREMEKRELVIFITPRIVTGQPAGGY